MSSSVKFFLALLAISVVTVAMALDCGELNLDQLKKSVPSKGCATDCFALSCDGNVVKGCLAPEYVDKCNDNYVKKEECGNIACKRCKEDWCNGDEGKPKNGGGEGGNPDGGASGAFGIGQPSVLKAVLATFGALALFNI